MDATNPLLWLLADSVRRVAWDGLPVNRQPPRTFVAAGPEFAHDCWQLVTHVESVAWARVTPAPPGLDGRLTGYAKGVLSVRIIATLVIDCIPIPDVSAQAITLPELDELNDTSRLIVSDAWTAYLAVRAASKDGVLYVTDAGAPLVDDEACAGSIIGDLDFRGPAGRTASARWPIDLNLPSTTVA